MLRVPLSALFRQGDAWAVFVAGNGRTEMRTVRVGRQNGLEAEILAGLRAGEAIVLHPGDRVADGVRIARRG